MLLLRVAAASASQIMAVARVTSIATVIFRWPQGHPFQPDTRGQGGPWPPFVLATECLLGV